MKNIRLTLLLVAALATTLASAQTRAEQNKTNYLQVMEGMNAQNFAAFEQHCTEDFQDNLPPGFSEATGLKGLAASKALLQSMFTAFPDMKFEVKEVVADDKTVFAYLVMSGTMKGEFMGMKPTGKSFKLDTVDIVWFNAAGKAYKHLGVQDNLDFFEQLGLTLGN
ncbi:MAG: ester cyclase [Saprospiraceae bacterium]|nr:ester cyclase [Saprospiraceae bacterium]